MPTVGESPRMQALKKMSASFPAANQQVAQGQQAARQIQLQQQVAQAPQGMGVRAAQATGAQQAGQAGQIATEAAKKGQAEQIQIGQLGLQERGTQLRGAQAQSELAFGEEKQKADQMLFDLDSDVKQEIFDRNMEFQRDELGRAKFNRDQLTDWTITKAQMGEDWQDHAQILSQNLEKEMKIKEFGFKRAEQLLKQKWAEAEQNKDHELKKYLKQLEIDMKKLKQQTEQNIAVKQAKVKAVVGIAKGAIKGATTSA